tara:strand:- start:37963 stop:38127 length:165 start_codon:yes stop_codon:yes gene_type:complete
MSIRVLTKEDRINRLKELANDMKFLISQHIDDYGDSEHLDEDVIDDIMEEVDSL